MIDSATGAALAIGLSNERPEIPEPVSDDAGDVLGYATRLACSMWDEHYKADSPNWQPLPDLMGVLTQIDNMLTGLIRNPKDRP